MMETVQVGDGTQEKCADASKGNSDSASGNSKDDGGKPAVDTGGGMSTGTLAAAIAAAAVCGVAFGILIARMGRSHRTVGQERVRGYQLHHNNNVYDNGIRHAGDNGAATNNDGADSDDDELLLTRFDFAHPIQT